MRADGAVVSAEELLEKAWDEHTDPFTGTVRFTILKLCRELAEPPVVLTVPRARYRPPMSRRPCTRTTRGSSGVPPCCSRRNRGGDRVRAGRRREGTETARRIVGVPVADHALNGRSDEVKVLADSFDTMVERLDRSFMTIALPGCSAAVIVAIGDGTGFPTAGHQVLGNVHPLSNAAPHFFRGPITVVGGLGPGGGIFRGPD